MTEQKAKRKTRTSDSSDVEPQKQQRTRKPHVHAFPWSTSYDINICAVWEAASGKPQIISKILHELGVDPCPTYDQVRSRIGTQEFKDTKLEFDEGK